MALLDFLLRPIRGLSIFDIRGNWPIAWLDASGALGDSAPASGEMSMVTYNASAGDHYAKWRPISDAVIAQVGVGVGSGTFSTKVSRAIVLNEVGTWKAICNPDGGSPVRVTLTDAGRVDVTATIRTSLDGSAGIDRRLKVRLNIAGMTTTETTVSPASDSNTGQTNSTVISVTGVELPPLKTIVIQAEWYAQGGSAKTLWSAASTIAVTASARQTPYHEHVQTEVTGLVTALAGKAPTVHAHAQADVTGLVTDLAGKAPSIHAHAQSDVTGLVTELATKATSIKRGRPKTGATTAFKVPGGAVSAQLTSSPLVDYTYYGTWVIESNESFVAWGLIVETPTTVVGSVARIALYHADENWQPLAKVAGCDASIPIDAAATNRIVLSTPVALAPGRYLSAVNFDDTVGGLTVTGFRGSADYNGIRIVSATPYWAALRAPGAIASMPDPGTAWTLPAYSASPFIHYLVAEMG